MLGSNTMIGDGRCVRNIEEEVASMKKRLDAFTSLHTSIKAFFEGGHYRWFDNHKQRDTMLSILAALSLEIPDMSMQYDKMLAELEASKK